MFKKSLFLVLFIVSESLASGLGLNYQQLQQRVNVDFQQIGLPFEMPKNIETTGDNPDIQVGSVLFDQGSGGNITLDKDKNVTSIIMMVTPSSDSYVNMMRYFATVFVVSAVDGDEGNKIVGGDITKMMTKLLDEYRLEPAKSHKNKIVRNGIKYGVIVSSGVPIMIYAEPLE